MQLNDGKTVAPVVLQDGRKLLDRLGFVHIKVKDISERIAKRVARVRLYVLHEVDQFYNVRQRRPWISTPPL